MMALRTLTVREVKALKSKTGMHQVALGLYLRVAGPSIAYCMLRRYPVAGKATEMSLGRFETLSLAEASVQAVTLRLGLKRDEVAPLAVKRPDAERGKGSTYADVAIGGCPDGQSPWNLVTQISTHTGRLARNGQLPNGRAIDT